jgi:bacterioferritin-associated ferredoxin
VAGIEITRCICRGVAFADLLPVARANGWDLAAVIRETGCGAGCGLCRPYLRRMLLTGEIVFHQLLWEEPR